MSALNVSVTSARLRQVRALNAARAVVGRYGMCAGEARMLSDCSNVVVHLAPLPVVAKVRTVAAASPCPAQQRELEIGLHLDRAGAPVAGPSSELPARVHRYRGHAVTFWRYQENNPAAVVDERAAGRVLAECHRALDSYLRPLPSSLSRQVSRAGRVLADPAELGGLAAGDRAWLAAMHARLSASVACRRPPPRVLHGDPHRGNLLVTSRGTVMIDFESACTGPLEWDLSALPGCGAGVFLGADHELLTILRQLRSLCVVVWCRQRQGRAPEIDRAARLHLDLLKDAHAFQ